MRQPKCQPTQHKQGETTERPSINKAPRIKHHRRAEQRHGRVKAAKSGIGEVEQRAYFIAVKRDEESLSEIRQPHHQKAEQQKAVMRANEGEIIHGAVLAAARRTGNALFTHIILHGRCKTAWPGRASDGRPQFPHRN